MRTVDDKKCFIVDMFILNIVVVVVLCFLWYNEEWGRLPTMNSFCNKIRFKLHYP